MIRMSSSKPKIVYQEGTNDMSHYSPSHFEALGDPYWITDDEFRGMWQFTDPSLKKVSQKEFQEISNLKDPTDEEKIQELILGSSKARQIKWALELNPNKSMVWEFNGMTLDFNAWVRHIIIFGEREDFILSSWFNAYVQFPVFKKIAHFLNILWYPKQLKEIKNWNNYLKEL